jgi:membrane-associated protein
MLLSPARLTVLEAFFARYGPPTVLMARFVSGLRVAAAFCAGMSHMPWRMFFLYNATGAVLWAATVSALGYLFGQRWEALEHWMGRVGLVAMLTVVVGLMGVALLRYARHLRYTGLLWLLRHQNKDKGEA